MKNEITKAENNLPVKLEDLSKFVLIGKEKLVSVKAEIRAMKNLKVAEDVYKQKEIEAKELGGTLLLAKVRIGELLKDIPGNQGKRTDMKPLHHREQKLKTDELKEMGITKKVKENCEQLADNKEIVEEVINTSEDIPTQTECLKKIQDKKKQAKKKENEEKIKAAATKKIDSNIKILEGDLFSLIGEVEYASVDLLCTDPPYFVLNKEESWDLFDSYKEFLEFTEAWLLRVVEKVKKTGRIYISFPCDYKYDLYNIIKKHNFFGFTFGNEIIWVKRNNNQMSNKKNYRFQYESILYLYGEKADKLNFKEYGEIQSNVWEIATPQSNFKEGKYHPAQKPIELYKRIISTGSNEKDLVLDCFGGSGTTGIVCKQLNRNCILIEKDKKYLDIIRGRINELD